MRKAALLCLLVLLPVLALGANEESKKANGYLEGDCELLRGKKPSRGPRRLGLCCGAFLLLNPLLKRGPRGTARPSMTGRTEEVFGGEAAVFPESPHPDVACAEDAADVGVSE